MFSLAAVSYFLWSLKPWEIDYSQGGQPEPQGLVWVFMVGRAGEDPGTNLVKEGPGTCQGSVG